MNYSQPTDRGFATTLSQSNLNVSNANKYWSRNPGVISRNFTGEYVLVPVKQSRLDMQKLYSLNEAGAFLWEELATKKTRSQLVQALYANFTLSAEQAQQDVANFIEDLAGHNLILATDE